MGIPEEKNVEQAEKISIQVNIDGKKILQMEVNPKDVIGETWIKQYPRMKSILEGMQVNRTGEEMDLKKTFQDYGMDNGH